jgi:hypothetical protein
MKGMLMRELIETILLSLEVHSIFDYIDRLFRQGDERINSFFADYHRDITQILPYLYQFKTSLMFIILPLTALRGINNDKLQELGWEADHNPQGMDTIKLIKIVRHAIAHFLEEGFDNDRGLIEYRDTLITFRPDRGEVSFTPEEYRYFVENTIKVARNHCREKLNDVI